MKRFSKTKIFLAITLSFWATGHVVFGQTNTFPSTGNAGVGTTSPFLPLHIQGTQSDALLPLVLLRNSSSTANSAVSLDFTNFSGTQTSTQIGARIQALRISSADSRHALVFSTALAGWALSEKMRLNDDGQLGIGTSTPQGKLDVANAFYTNPGLIVLRAQDSMNEGGQLRFEGAGTNRYFYLDNFAGNLRFFSQDSSGSSEKIRILNNGSVGIGTTSPNANYKLSVNGKIRAKEVVVETNWSDFVFADDYKLMPLDELEKSVKQNRHLPGIPSEKEVAESGVSLGEMQSKLLQKIEELTLYVIDLKKENARLHERVDMLEKKPQ